LTKFWSTASHIATFACGVIATVAFFTTSSDQLDFSGLRVSAEIIEDAKPKVFIPANYQNAPIAAFARGSVINTADPSALPLPFNVSLSSVNESSSTTSKTIVYEHL